MFKENRLVFQQPGAGGEVPHASELKEGVKAPETGEKQDEKSEGIGQEKADSVVAQTETMMKGMLQSALETVNQLGPEEKAQFEQMVADLNARIAKETGYQLVSFSYNKEKGSLEAVKLPADKVKELAGKSANDMDDLRLKLAQAYMLITDHSRSWDGKLADKMVAKLQ